MGVDARGKLFRYNDFVIKAVGVIIRNSEKHILVLKRNKNDPEGNKYGLVGGKLESDENSLQAALREMTEEIGIEFNEKDLNFINNYIWIRDDISLYFDVYLIEILDRDLVMNLQKNEVTEYLWETKERLLGRDDLMIGLYEILGDLC